MRHIGCYCAHFSQTQYFPVESRGEAGSEGGRPLGSSEEPEGPDCVSESIFPGRSVTGSCPPRTPWARAASQGQALLVSGEDSPGHVSGGVPGSQEGGALWGCELLAQQPSMGGADTAAHCQPAIASPKAGAGALPLSPLDSSLQSGVCWAALWCPLVFRAVQRPRRAGLNSGMDRP